MKRFIAFLMLTGTFLLGCKFLMPDASSTPAPLGTSLAPLATPTAEITSLPALSGDWQVKMTQSGGIMGLMRSVEISADGSYTVTDGRTSKSTNGQLSKTELESLVKMVESSQYSKYNLPYGCADCFIYDIEITSGDGNFSVQLDDVSLGDSGLESLVKMLREIIDRDTLK
jgi:hypothetical protein